VLLFLSPSYLDICANFQNIHHHGGLLFRVGMVKSGTFFLFFFFWMCLCCVACGYILLLQLLHHWNGNMGDKAFFNLIFLRSFPGVKDES